MSIVAISYGACDIRDNIASEVADILDYECIGREVLRSASEKFNIPEAKLSRAIHYAPSLFGMSVKTRDRYVAYTLAAAAEFLMRDNIVYHGPAAHVIAQGISHVLRVRIIPSHEARITFAMQRDNITREMAQELIRNDEKEREKWSKQVFGVDDSNPTLYDLMIHTGEIDTQKAIDRITTTLHKKKFQPMTYSTQCAANVELTYRVKAYLIDLDPDVRVRVEDGHVTVDTAVHGKSKEKSLEIIQERVRALSGVKSVEIHMTEDLFERIAGTMR